MWFYSTRSFFIAPLTIMQLKRVKGNAKRVWSDNILLVAIMVFVWPNYRCNALLALLS